MIISKIDGTLCKNNLGLSIHLKKYRLSVLEYYIQYEGLVIPKCLCGKDCKLMVGKDFRETCGNSKCLNELKKNIRHTEETKNKMRVKRIEYLKKTRGKDSAWKRRSEGKMSQGEQILHDIFVDNEVYKKYTVVNEYCEFPYFIDFAFINEKVAVEYDGRCHFNYGVKRIEHDFKKDSELKKLGWRVYRIPYFELNTFELNDLLKFIGNPKKSENFNALVKYQGYITKKVDKKYYCNCGNEKGKNSKKCSSCSSTERRKVERPKYQDLIEEIKNLGYKGTGKKYGVSDNTIRKWLINYK